MYFIRAKKLFRVVADFFKPAVHKHTANYVIKNERKKMQSVGGFHFFVNIESVWNIFFLNMIKQEEDKVSIINYNSRVLLVSLSLLPDVDLYCSVRSFLLNATQ